MAVNKDVRDYMAGAKISGIHITTQDAKAAAADARLKAERHYHMGNMAMPFSMTNWDQIHKDRMAVHKVNSRIRPGTAKIRPGEELGDC